MYEGMVSQAGKYKVGDKVEFKYEGSKLQGKICWIQAGADDPKMSIHVKDQKDMYYVTIRQIIRKV